MRERYIETTLRHVHLQRGGREVLRGIDWTIRPAERWILAGANGAGKTQLLKLVAGNVWPTPRPDTVRAWLWRGERHAVPLEVKDEIGYVGPERQDRYERYGWNHSVEQIVGTGLYRTDIPLDPLTRADRRTIAALLDRLGLGALAGRGFLTLSYGERRLTLLARALAARPSLLLLDELLNGLDAARRAAALSWLARTRRSALPWVLSTHRVEDVPPGATHALVLERGRVVYRGRITAAPLRKWLAPALPRPRSRPAGKQRAASPAQWLVRLTHASVYLDERRVLSDISFTVARGECWVIHGPNGSGKSTLLRTIYGDHGVAAGGKIERAGVEPGVALDTFKRSVGLVAPHLQSALAATTSLAAGAPERISRGLAEPRELTVSETVESGLDASFGLDGRASSAARRAGRRALAALSLSPLAGRRLRELSYGQLRRVLFARALIGEPALLLLDEPFAGLDGRTRGELLREVASLAQSGTTVVMATHHHEEWPLCTTHELELAAGSVLYRGPVRMGSGTARPADGRREPHRRSAAIVRSAARRGRVAAGERR